MKNTFYQKLVALAITVLMLIPEQMCWAEAVDYRPAAERQTYERLVDAWAETLEDQEADVVFLGDSITAMGEWDAYFEDVLVENLGVVADYVLDVQMRLPLLEALEADKCFLMIGVNDLRRKDAEEEHILQAYHQLLAELYDMSEETGMTVYVQSVLPILEGKHSRPHLTNEMIRHFNENIEEMAEACDMTYIDIHSLLTDENGQLREEYTSDGLHVYPNAYQVWSEALIPYIEE